MTHKQAAEKGLKMLKSLIFKIKNIGKKRVTEQQQEDMIKVINYHRYMAYSGMFDDAEDRAARKKWEDEIYELEKSLPDDLRKMATNPNLYNEEHIRNRTYIPF